MYHPDRRQPFVLALAPNTCGLGYAVFEGPHNLVDFGMKFIDHKRIEEELGSMPRLSAAWTERKKATRKNAQCYQRARHLVDWYRPEILLIEDHRGEGSHRRKRIVRLLDRLRLLGEREGIQVRAYSRGQIDECFEAFDARTKHDIARQIARWFPELASKLPKERKLWTSESCQMGIFDAVSLAITAVDEPFSP